MAPLELAVEPRDWQRSALAAWEGASRRGVVQVVTGGGKTIFAELCMARVAEAAPDVRFVILVPTQALLDQWFVSLGEELRVPEADVATYSGRSKPKEPRAFNLMVMNTARTAAPVIARRARTMLVVDECHRVGSPVNALALAGDHFATLGMSATPERDYDAGFSEVVAPALGRVVYRYGLNEAGRDGILSPFDLINVRVQMLADEEAEYARLTARVARLAKRAEADPVTRESFEALLRRRARVSARASMRVPVAVKVSERHRGARCLIFHEEIDQAEAILKSLRERGHSATVYHSRVGPTMRRDNLRLFRRGVFDVLVSCRALDEGINIPETQVAVIASASASTRQRIQRLGRVLRPAPGKDAATVYTLYASKNEEERLASEAAHLKAARTISWESVQVKRG